MLIRPLRGLAAIHNLFVWFPYTSYDIKYYGKPEGTTNKPVAKKIELTIIYWTDPKKTSCAIYQVAK